MSQAYVQWCNEHERGIFSRPFQLGRVRGSSPADLARPPLDLSGPVLEPLDRSYRNYAVELSRPAPERVLLVLKAPGDQDYEVRFLVDTARHVVLTMEARQEGKLANRTKYDEFVELLGTWWATRVETADGQGRRTSLVMQTFEPLDAKAAAREIDRALDGRDRVQLIKEPLPAVAEAKQAVADGKDAYSDRLALVLHFAESQQWTRVMEHLDASEKLAEDKPGVRVVRDAVLNAARRHEELKARILAEATSLAEAGPDDLREPNRLFLAEYMMNQASGILEANEGLALLVVLRPVYEAAPEYVHAIKRWTEQRINRLQQTGRAAEALELQRQRAARYPHDYNVQQQYANALFNAGDYAAGYAWLDASLAPDREWQPYEENSLRGVYVQQMRREGRYQFMATFLETWLQRHPDSSDPYAQYLSALIHAGREDEANRLIEQWLKDARNPRRLDPPTAARLQAAVNHALGRGYNLYTDRIDDRWLEPLAETALFFADHPSHAHVADTIMTHHHQFQQTDACRSVRTVALGRLEDGIGTLAPPVVDRYANWLLPNDPAVETGTWRTLAAALRKRWDAEKDDAQRHQLGATLGQILSDSLPADEYLAFLRAQLEEGPAVYVSGYARELFNTLLAQPWRQAYEDEAFGLLDRLAELESRPGDEGASERLVRRVADLHRLTDAMLQARFAAGVAAIERPKDLSRTELRAKREGILREAREGLAARLGKEMDTREGAFVRWLNVERHFLEVQLGRELDRVADECWEMLGPKPPRLAPGELAGESPDPAEELDQMFKGRCLLTLAHLAARRNARPELIDRVLGFIDAGMAAEPEAEPEPEAWRQLKYQMLVALDRPKQLEAALHSWIRPEQAVNHWRLVLGYLLAEQGKVPAAIEQFEAIRAADELGPAEYRILADWYMAVDRREDHEQALVAVYKTAEEWELNNRLSQHLQPWQRNEGEMPAELNPEVLPILAALLAKAQHPQSYTYQAREFYRHSRDFRLLAGMADAVIGHTA
ncbi:MAG: hypothetical protein U1E05_16470, partial [Patescibacteria group bacterium]|nr:hypothetical protein [Patescibacteria group bacterium]